MYIDKKYFLLIENGTLVVPISFGLCNTNDNPNIFQSDSLDDCINECLNNNILDFDIPIEYTTPNCERAYWKPIKSDNILVRYENGQPVYQDKVLTGWHEMTEEEKDTIGLKNKLIFFNWKIKDANFRLHILFNDCLNSGVFSDRFNETIIKKIPFFRVNENHIEDENGTFIDLYYKTIDADDIPTLESYFQNNPGTKLDSFNLL